MVNPIQNEKVTDSHKQRNTNKNFTKKDCSHCNYNDHNTDQCFKLKPELQNKLKKTSSETEEELKNG